MHPEIRQDHPGTCPICGGMKLVAENEVKFSIEKTSKSFFSTYKPLFIIVGMVMLAAVIPAIHAGNSWQDAMLNFMAGFFLVFSGLKLLDVAGFAEGYSTYDLLAQRVRGYGYVYPFLELLLGLLYLTRINLPVTNIATIILMLFSGIGVAIKLSKGEKFQCACLGTMIKVPLTKVTLIEDFGMAAMAFMLL